MQVNSLFRVLICLFFLGMTQVTAQNLTVEGDIGIGTDTPEDKLHIVGGDILVEDSFPFLILKASNTFANLCMIFRDEDGVGLRSFYYDKSESTFKFVQGAGSIADVAISPEGFLGIGTEEPVQELEVDGDIALSDGTGRIEFLEENTVKAFLNYNGSTLSLTNNETSGGDVIIDAQDDVSLVASDDIFIRSGANTDITINDSGKVGINQTSPEFNLDIDHELAPSGQIFTSGAGLLLSNLGSGNVDWAHYVVNSSGNYAWLKDNNTIIAEIDGSNGNWVPGSDRKLKKDIEQLEDNQLEKIMQLRPSSYVFKNQKGEDRSFGLIAQEVRKVYPNIVVEMGEGGQQLGVSYTELIPVLIAGMQEQQQKIQSANEELKSTNEELRSANADLQREVDGLKERLAKIEAMLENQQPTTTNSDLSTHNIQLTSAKLEQNQPNPFNGSTIVRYFIPEGVIKAELRVTDSAGKVIKSIAISALGEGQVTFDATTLGSGTYQYSLILDGKPIATRQMVLTKN